MPAKTKREALAIHIKAILENTSNDKPLRLIRKCFCVGVSSAVKLSADYYPIWAGKVSVPRDQVIEWKCIMRNEYFPTEELVWQSGSNNILFSDRAKVVSASF